MRYEQARSLIQTGDLISVKRTDSLLALATRFFTRSPYTHSGLALWLADGLWMAELNGGGNHLIPMSQLTNRSFDVSSRPADISASRVAEAILSNMRVHVSYGFLALPVIGLLNWLKLKFTGKQRRIVVCSGYCINVYIDAGWPERTRMMSPADLAAALEFKFSVEVS